MEDFRSRNKSRKEAVCKLYTASLMNDDVDISDLDEYATFLVLNVISRNDEIIDIISKCLTNYSINRLNYVDLSIIKIATLEMLVNEVPTNIVINEAINITKIYSNLDDDKAKAFNNRLLDNISKYIKGE